MRLMICDDMPLVVNDVVVNIVVIGKLIQEQVIVVVFVVIGEVDPKVVKVV